jgi:hypothetical protein
MLEIEPDLLTLSGPKTGSRPTGRMAGAVHSSQKRTKSALVSVNVQSEEKRGSVLLSVR